MRQRVIAVVLAAGLVLPGCATISAGAQRVEAVVTANQLVFKIALDRAVNAYIYAAPNPAVRAARVVAKAQAIRARAERGAVVDLARLADELRAEINLDGLAPMDRATVLELAAAVERELARQVKLGKIEADAPVLLKAAVDRVIETAGRAL